MIKVRRYMMLYIIDFVNYAYYDEFEIINTSIGNQNACRI